MKGVLPYDQARRGIGDKCHPTMEAVLMFLIRETRREAYICMC